MSNTRSKPAFIRRVRPGERVDEFIVPFSDEERPVIEARAAALNLSFDDYLMMLSLEARKVKGNA